MCVKNTYMYNYIIIYVCVCAYVYTYAVTDYIRIYNMCVQILCVCVFVPVYRFTSAKYEKAVFVDTMVLQLRRLRCCISSQSIGHQGLRAAWGRSLRSLSTNGARVEGGGGQLFRTSSMASRRSSGDIRGFFQLRMNNPLVY